MFTLITGNPGAGKTLYAVWELLRPIPGTTLEDSTGKPVARRLLANIPELTLDHELVDNEQLGAWHTWAKPGDVICGDEIQHVFRPRTLGTKVPEAIQAVETHRHLGVDLLFITQHPNLMDVNLRRLVNRHFHVRRVMGGLSMVYEWDHCGTPGDYKGCVGSRMWRHPKAAYALYKSAQLHTKPTARIPAVAYLGIAALVAMAAVVPWAYARVNTSLGGGDTAAAKPAATQPRTATSATHHAPAKPHVEPLPMPTPPEAPSAAPAPLVAAGCGKVRHYCECYSATGERVPVEPAACEARLPRDLVTADRLSLDARLRALVPDALPRPDQVPADVDLLAWAVQRR